jgi:hypothetical protein
MLPLLQDFVQIVKYSMTEMHERDYVRLLHVYLVTYFDEI